MTVQVPSDSASVEQVHHDEMLDDLVLRFAFQILDQYDRAALKLKVRYLNARVAVLSLGFLTSLLAVSLSAGGSFAPTLAILGSLLNININVSPVLLDSLARILLFFLPLAASTILIYITQQSTGKLPWVYYRIRAENIRRAIYCYCLSAGDYQGKSAAEKKVLLSQAQDEITAESDQLPAGVVVKAKPLTDSQYRKWLIASFKTDNRTLPQKFLAFLGRNRQDDNPKSLAPTFEDYYSNRFEAQIRWYEHQAAKDYQAARRWQICGLVVGAAGSLLTFQQYVPWVAVTTAGAVAINQLGSLKMAGRTYATYQGVANKLHSQRIAWFRQDATIRNDPVKQAGFVAETEGYFEDEIKGWSQIAERTLTQADRDLGSQTPQQNALNADKQGNSHST